MLKISAISDDMRKSLLIIISALIVFMFVGCSRNIELKALKSMKITNGNETFNVDPEQDAETFDTISALIRGEKLRNINCSLSDVNIYVINRHNEEMRLQPSADSDYVLIEEGKDIYYIQLTHFDMQMLIHTITSFTGFSIG